MEKLKITKYFNLAVIIIAAVSALTAGAAVLLKSVHNVTYILSFVRAVIILIALIILYKKAVGFEQNKFKSIPIMLLPLGVFGLIRGIITPLIELIPFTGDKVINDAIELLISSALALAICLAALQKPINRYAAIYEEKSALIFPPEYRLSSKWWFLLVGLIVGGFVTATLSIIGNYAGTVGDALASAIGTAALYLIIYAFFNNALGKIDKDTRKLFIPSIFLLSIGGILNAVSDLFKAFVPSLSPQDALAAVSSTNLAWLAKLIPVLLFTALFSVIEIVIICFLCKKNFESYENVKQDKDQSSGCAADLRFEF